jgi:hypothetical protein
MMNTVLFGSSGAHRLSLSESAEQIQQLTQEALCTDSAALYLIDPVSKTMVSLPHSSTHEGIESFRIADSSAAWTVIRGQPWRSVSLKYIRWGEKSFHDLELLVIVLTSIPVRTCALPVKLLFEHKMLSRSRAVKKQIFVL